MRFQLFLVAIFSMLSFYVMAAPTAESHDVAVVERRSVPSARGLTGALGLQGVIYALNIFDGSVQVVDGLQGILGTLNLLNGVVQILDTLGAVIGTLEAGLLVAIILDNTGTIIGTILTPLVNIITLLTE
ncbi:MAG: hypothetical protein M1814_003781 [Vezdaea aestivalis]|nr:MAG: hypothetical protein M1814_003781 [Vezdaea aestivalis]